VLLTAGVCIGNHNIRLDTVMDVRYPLRLKVPIILVFWI
jgi:hypothetical protein